MITIDEARELVNARVIEFPVNWRQQILTKAETTIRNAATSGSKHCTIKGEVSAANGGFGYFFLNPEQFSDIAGEIRKHGFVVEEDFRIRYTNQPLTIDVYWV